MPSLGADMEAGTVVEWRVGAGDRVARGDVVVLVETEKGLIEVEIFDSGVVESILVSPGTKVPVGTPLAMIRGDAAAAAAVSPTAVAATPPTATAAPIRATTPTPAPQMPVEPGARPLASPL